MQKVDWEVELAIVIGKKGKSLNNHEAEEYIFGYTIAQDISARDWQKGSRNGGQFLLGKAMDSFCPLGPAIVTKEAICDINNLSVKTWVNGQLKQDGNTSELIFKPHDIVAYLSQCVQIFLYYLFIYFSFLFYLIFELYFVSSLLDSLLFYLETLFWPGLRAALDLPVIRQSIWRFVRFWYL